MTTPEPPSRIQPRLVRHDVVPLFSERLMAQVKQWSRFGWHGVTFDVPADWDLRQFHGTRRKGYAQLCDPDVVRLELRWERPVTIDAARVVSGFHDGGGVIAPIHHFAFERFDGENWQEIPDTRMRNNVRVDWQRRFKPVTTDRVRLRVDHTQGDVSRIWEIELYAPADE